MTTRVVRVLAFGSLIALAACEGERTTENQPFGPPSYNFRLTSLSRGVPRSGGQDAVFLTFLTLDTSIADAFGRQGDLAVRLRGASSWDLRSTMRRLAVDGRAPTQVAPTTAVNAATMTLQGPDLAATGGMWRFTISLTGLAASTGYTVALFRYGLKTGSTATDTLDQVAALMTGSNFTTRDSLFVLGGTGASPSLTGGCTAAAAAVSSATANPLIIGTFTSTAAGASGTQTKCINDTGSLYYRGNEVVSLNRTPIAPNTVLTFGLPQYNYIVVYVTASGATTGTTLRGQIGQDLDYVTANPVNNAFAPFPCRAVANNCTVVVFNPPAALASNVLTTRQRIAAPGGDASVDSVTISLRGLKELGASGVYQAWLVNPSTGATPVPAVGRRVATQIDTVTDAPVLVLDTTVLDSTENVSSFGGFAMPQASHVTWRFKVFAAATGVSLRDYTHLLITLEPGGPAAAPSSNTALWLRFADHKGTATFRDDDYFDAAPTVALGRLDLANVATRVFTAAGRGFGGYRGDEVSVDLNDLTRPPVGYYYQAWLQDVNGPDSVGADTTYVVGTDTSYVAVDTLRAPFPGRALLLDADASIPDPVVQDVPPVIRSANIRAFAANIGLSLTRPCVPTNPARGFCPFGAFENYLVTLEPKGSSPTSPSPSIVFTSSLPSVVKTGK